jgi:hypothetical protein
LHLLEVTIPCKIYIQHVYRRPCKLSKLADDLSREKTSKKLPNQSFSKHKIFHLTEPLKKWIENPNPTNHLFIDVINKT